MSEQPEYLTVDDDLSWQRGDTPVGALAAGSQVVEEGNRMGALVDVDDNDDNGLDRP